MRISKPSLFLCSWRVLFRTWRVLISYVTRYLQVTLQEEKSCGRTWHTTCANNGTPRCTELLVFGGSPDNIWHPEHQHWARMTRFYYGKYKLTGWILYQISFFAKINTICFGRSFLWIRDFIKFPPFWPLIFYRCATSIRYVCWTHGKQGTRPFYTTRHFRRHRVAKICQRLTEKTLRHVFIWNGYRTNDAHCRRIIVQTLLQCNDLPF